MEDKVTNKIVLSILKFLRKEVESGTLTEDASESVEVAIQCLELAYGVDATMEVGHIIPDLVELFCASDVWTIASAEGIMAGATEEAKSEAETLKNEGNTLMKQDKFEEAIKKYSNAIMLDGSNAVYYCNRAAAQSKLNNHLAAIEDCKRALALDPTYSKAYGRLGLAYSSINRPEDARASYLKALELEPNNESYKNNLSLTTDQINLQDTQGTAPVAGSSETSAPAFDFSMLINNPALMELASGMLNNPAMQNIMSNMILMDRGNTSLEALLQAGQQLARQMQAMNPEFVENLRRHMGPPDGGDAPNDDDQGGNGGDAGDAPGN